MNLKKIIFIIFINLSFSFLFSLSYDVKFIGLTDAEIISSIKNSTDIFLLKDKPPRTINALRYRIEKDLSSIVKTFYAYGYFDATVNYDIEEEKKEIDVYIFCDPGPRYLLNEYKICYFPCEKESCNKINLDLKKLGIKLLSGTNSQELLDAKKNAIYYLAEEGYPLAKIENYEVIADGIRKTIDVKICINPGPFCTFGPVSILGLKDIYPKYILNKIKWKEGETFTPEKIKETQTKLTESGLFSSVSITYDKKMENDTSLPITIKAIESNHQNISLGANYASVDGPGGIFSYTNYNMGHMGEILTLHGEFAKRALTGYISYKKPDFLWLDQDYLISGYAQRERINPYHSFTYGIMTRMSHRVTRAFHYGYGLKGEHIDITNSANNNRFLLIGVPFYLRYNTSNHLLNPTTGFGLIYTMTPYFNLNKDGGPFLKQKITTELYIPAKKNEKLVFATRLQFGSIVGQSVYNIPMNKLFLGGCEDDLRGYRYKTVGPRNSDKEIIGGRSVIYFTFEPRLRLTKKIGIVPFFDMGNIQLSSAPTLKGKWRKAIGGGFRYFTFFGPLRLDVAFPMDKYNKGDPNYRIYISLGQTF